jgi:hypothetical protein
MKGNWYFWSDVIGAKINDENCGQVISQDDLLDVSSEVLRALQNTKQKLTHAIRNRMDVAPRKIAEIEQSRKGLALLHQALLRQISIKSRSEKQERIRQNEELERMRPFEKYFQIVVKHEASPADYHRWIAQAKQMQLSSKPNND